MKKKKKTLKLMIVEFFEYSENLINIVIAILLIITALFLIYFTILTFFNLPEEKNFIRWIVDILDKILLTLMILEILYTVRMFFTRHSLNAEPFLVVALIAAIRRILVISVESAHLPERFNQHMIEIAILGVLIFIFVFSIIFLRKQVGYPTHVPSRGGITSKK